MTDLLLKPEDTGEIPTDHGLATENLKPYVNGLPPAFRRPETIRSQPAAVLDLIGGCRRIDTDDEDEFEVLPTAPIPTPVPDPQPDPQVGRTEVLWAEIVGTGEYLPKRSVLYAPSADRKPGPRGRHRRRSWMAWLTRPLAMAWQRVVDAL